MSYKTSISEFQSLLSTSHRILALCGAGLSASSGLPTFRGAGGLWRNHESTSLATPEAFEADPVLVWLFYAWRRHMALKAEPNAAHFALAELARRMNAEDGNGGGFMCLTQNVDGLSQRASHPSTHLKPLHGNILTLKCFAECGYIEPTNLSDPLCPALAAGAEDFPPDRTLPLLDPSIPLPEINIADLPHCPACKAAGRRDSLLRPGVVWFGEALDENMLMEVENWIYKSGKIDIMLVIGTAAAVYPAAGYTRKAKRRGAVVVVVNPDPQAAEGLGDEDFWFGGDAAEVVPRLLEGVIGKGNMGGGGVSE